MKQLGPHKVELTNWIELAPFEVMLNMEILSAHNGEAILTMPFVYELSQGAGLMHGGALMSLADTSLAMAVKTCLPENSRFGTISFDSKFLRPTHEGIVKAIAKVVLVKERTYEGKVSVFDHNENLVLEANAVFKVARNH